MRALVAAPRTAKEIWERVTSRLKSGRSGAPSLDLALRDAPEPSAPGPQWVRIRAIASGISDIDLKMIVHGDLSPFGAFLSYPFTPGNEALGIVTDVGAEVHGVEPGRRVVIDPVLSCEPRGIEPLCPSCQKGVPSSCRNFGEGRPGPGVIIGACKGTGGGWGDFLIAHKSRIRAVPQGMDSDQAILLPEFTRAVRAVLQHPPNPADRVVILGGGSLGLLLYTALHALGCARNALMIALHDHEAEIANTIGLGAAFVSRGPGTMFEEVAAKIGAAVRYDDARRPMLLGGADIVYETTGEGPFMEDAIRLAGEEKKVVLAGMKSPFSLDPGNAWLRGIRVVSTSFSGLERYNDELTDTYDVAIDLAVRHGLPAEALITHRFTLEESAKALHAAARPDKSRSLKVIFQHVF
jgi:threonine dehydrogenase-like Zn-dependent dehydrogenase